MGTVALSAETDLFIIFLIGFAGMLFSLFAGTVCELAAMALSAVMFFRREKRVFAGILFLISLLLTIASGYLAFRIGTNMIYG